MFRCNQSHIAGHRFNDDAGDLIALVRHHLFNRLDVIKRQRDQTMSFMNKVENLEKIIQMGMTMQKRNKLEDLLQRVVELVRDNVGFRSVTLRLLNDKAKSFETHAYVGLSPEVRDTVVHELGHHFGLDEDDMPY